jgi:hypothetical protein
LEKGYYDIQQYLEDYADHCPDKEIRIIQRRDQRLFGERV